MSAAACLAQRIRMLFFLCLSLSLAALSSAQDTSQICVMCFEDRDGNGQFDDDEAPVTRGIAVNVQSASGITVATKLLEAAASSVPGLLCIEDLPRGDYHVQVTSALYQATTASLFSAAVAPGSAPVRLDFGLRPLGSSLPSAAQPAQGAASQLTAVQLQALERLGISLAASLIISIVMLLAGCLVYSLVFPRRLQRLRTRRQDDSLRSATTAMMPRAFGDSDRV